MMLLLLACRPPPLVDPAVALLAELDRDGSGTLTADELYSTTAPRTLTALDTDGSGALDLSELRAAMSPPEPGR
jgi:Ca2+-binding EF-hand superfamily protein